MGENESSSALLNDGLGPWICCKDKLPEPKTWGLVVGRQRMVTTANRAFGAYGGWAWHDGRSKQRAQSVFTHWMPLPEPPSE